MFLSLRTVKNSITFKFLLPVILLVCGAISLMGGLAAQRLTSALEERAASQASTALEMCQQEMALTDRLVSKQVMMALRLIKARSVQEYGEPSAAGTTTFQGHEATDLRLGGKSVANTTSLVDEVSGITEATATVFAVSGKDFIRISTSVRKPNGERAVGTLLDPKGAAYAALSQGTAFYGMVDILDKPYLTGYEPIRDSAGRTIGVFYAGYPVTALKDLGDAVTNTKILENGWIAVLDKKGRIILKSQSTSEEEIRKILAAGKESDSVTREQTFGPWSYRTVTSYPKSDERAGIRRVYFSTAVLMLLAIGLLVASLYWMIKVMIVKPLRIFEKALESADLNTQLEVRDEDEVGALCLALNRFISRIRGVLLSVQSVSERVAISSETLSSSSDQMARGAEVQNSEAMGISAALEEMSANVTMVNDRCQQGAAQALETTRLAQQGGSLVGSTMDGVKQMASSIQEVTEVMERLGQSSNEIGKVVAVIDGIADQTNLLALNAAIEAARAGEQGRGFAVVADEVRKLADRTVRATSEIGKMIEAIQQDTDVALQAMNHQKAEMSERSNQAGTARTALEEIVTSTCEMDSLVQQIADAAGEHSKATENVTQHMQQITEMAQQATNAAKDTAAACMNLTHDAEELKSVVAQFKLNSGLPGALRQRPEQRMQLRRVQ